MKRLLLLIVLLLVPIQYALAQQEPAAKETDKPAAREADKPAAKEADKPKNLDPSPKNARLKPGTIQLLRYWFADADKWMEYAVFVPKSFKPEEKRSTRRLLPCMALAIPRRESCSTPALPSWPKNTATS